MMWGCYETSSTEHGFLLALGQPSAINLPGARLLKQPHLPYEGGQVRTQLRLYKHFVEAT